MQKSVRRTLFYFLIAAFVVITPVIVLYAVGYGIDLTARSLTRTGGFFVKTNVAGIQVLVDNVPKTETNFISRGALVAGLDPGLYAVRIEKEGYFPWRKSIEVSEQVIQEFRSVILVPEKPPGQVIAAFGTSTPTTTIREFLPSSDGSLALLATRTGERESLHIIENAEEQFAVVLPRNHSFASAAWSNSDDTILIRQQKIKDIWSVLSLSTRALEPLFVNPTLRIAGTSSPEVLTVSTINDILPQPGSSDFFYLAAGGELYLWNRRANTAEKILENIFSFSPAGDRLMFITKSGFLAESNFDGSDIQTLERPGFFLGDRPFSFHKSDSGLRSVIDSAGGLYIENLEENRFTPVQGNDIRLRGAPNRNALAFSSGSLIQTVMLADEPKQPFRKRYARTSVIDALVSIRDFIWLGEDSTHFVFTTDQGVFLTEEDSRFGANTVTLRAGLYKIVATPDLANAFYLINPTSVERIEIPQ